VKHAPLATLGAALVLLSGVAAAQSLLVTPDNFRRAETDMYFGIFRRLELHGAVVPATARGPERQVDVPGCRPAMTPSVQAAP
jgi:hypothetical protein